jgi:hypothetical protein
MNNKDKAALELAMKIASRDRQRAAQLKDFLEGDEFTPPRPWEDVAKFAASVCQSNALNLKPWESPPCHPGPDPFGGDASVKLRERMDEAGVSPWHPDPMAALRAKRKPA